LECRRFAPRRRFLAPHGHRQEHARDRRRARPPAPRPSRGGGLRVGLRLGPRRANLAGSSARRGSPRRSRGRTRPGSVVGGRTRLGRGRAPRCDARLSRGVRHAVARRRPLRVHARAAAGARRSRARRSRVGDPAAPRGRRPDRSRRGRVRAPPPCRCARATSPFPGARCPRARRLRAPPPGGDPRLQHACGMAGPARRDLAFVIPMRTKLDALVRHRDAALDELRLHYVEAGPDDRDAPTIVLLHGFPDFWYGWRYQLVALAEAGVRVLAPDLRGYDRSDKPSSVAAYAVRPLVQDIVQLLERTCSAPPLLVGHDWGGILAWWTAMLAPHCIDRLAIVNAPHPAQLRTAMTRPAQALRLWYVLYFQLPWVPERLLARDGHAPLLETLRRYGVIVTDDDRTRYAEAFAQGSLTAMLNYYRALGRP